MKNKFTETLSSKKIGLALSLILLGASLVMSQTAPKYKILDFNGVGGFPHDSRPAASTLLDSLGKALNIQVDHSALASVFTDANLAQYKVLIINNSTELGKIATTVEQKAAIIKFMKSNGYLGFHGAGDTKVSFPEYTTYLGGELSTHGGGNATLNLDTSNYAKNISFINKGLLPQYILGGEWYAYKTNPRLAPGIQILYGMDESSCSGCVKMATPDHPIAWVHIEPVTGGRAFYMAMGHEKSVFTNYKWIKQMVSNALKWAAREPGTEEVVGPVSVRQTVLPGNNNFLVKSQNAALTVETTEKGAHTFELLTLDGKRVGSHKGVNSESYTFTNLRSSTVYSVVSYTKKGKESHLVTVQ